MVVEERAPAGAGIGGTGGGGAETRIDLHLHSRASGMATNWWVKGLGLGTGTRESYTPPADAYAMATRAGMDVVTLTDHETIDGALELAGRPGFPSLLIGEEVSATFPEDGSWVDVLVYGVDPAAHRELQARREDVYRLVEYLREAGLVHVLAHPMFALGEPLSRAAVEKRLVLFGLWEFVNGSRPAEQNRLAREVATGVDALDLRRLAVRHGLPNPPHRAVRGTGGSDDHGGIYGGATYTRLPRVNGVADLLAALAAGEVAPGGEDGSVDKMAQTAFRIAGIAAGERAEAGEAGRADGGPAAGLLGAAAGADPKLLEYVPLLAMLNGEQVRQALVGRYEQRISGVLRGMGDGSSVLGLVSSIGGFVDGHLFIAPYVGIHGYFGRERQKARRLRRELFPERAEAPKVGVFVDDLDEVHGVATMYRNLARLAGRAGDGRVRVVRCGGTAEGEGAGAGGGGAEEAIARLRPIGTLPLPLYEGMTLGVPSLLEVLDHVAAEGYDLLHVATPGPLGVAALVAATTLGLPTVGAYHTEFGAYAGALAGDAMVGEIVEVLVRQFYERCAAVAVPSGSTAAALRARGYRIGRFETLRNGVDTALYGPERRDEAYREALTGGRGRTALLYAGRVSREKGLERLAAGYLALRRRRDDVHLVIAGDGPYRAELATMLGETATFTGFLGGEALARTYASCDLFAFPSTTDTLGRAVAEAQASGLPAVVFGMGGPRECIRPGESGLVVEEGDEAGFFARIEELVDDPARRARMGIRARAFAETLSWEGVLAGLVTLYGEVADAAGVADALDGAAGDPAAVARGEGAVARGRPGEVGRAMVVA